MVFFQPSDAASPHLAREIGEELAVFGVGGRLREAGPSLGLVPPADDADGIGGADRELSVAGVPRFQRAVRRETRSAYRPMIFDDELSAAPAPAPAPAPTSVAPALASASAAPELAPAPAAPVVRAAAAAAPAIPIGVWRLRREHPHELRILADSNDRRAWLEQRAAGVTATDAARLATEASIAQVVREKVRGSSFGGNAYTDFGRQREPHIAAWVAERHGIEPCGMLYHAEGARRHLATPDGLFCDDEGRVTLAEIKTTNKPWSRIPRSYLRQVWWQQYVLGAERTLFVWERHRDFVVVDDEPKTVWIERDEDEIARLAALADRVLDQVESLRAHLEPPY